MVVAHGQMSERHLEKAMRSFLDGEADVLLATAIIENGLDIPNANTLLVNRADRFGLAQLYQLRGRVGRSERLAFAYFLVPPGKALSPTSRARLSAIQEFCNLGAGFRIAARDLEIRGAGNLLGAEQHGFLEAVGFETYCQLLEEAVAELEGRPAESQREVELRLGVDLQLPERYLPEPALRSELLQTSGCLRRRRGTRESARRNGRPIWSGAVAGRIAGGSAAPSHSGSEGWSLIGHTASRKMADTNGPGFADSCESWRGCQPVARDQDQLHRRDRVSS